MSKYNTSDRPISMNSNNQSGSITSKNFSPLKAAVAFEHPRTPSIIRHLKIFKSFGGTFQVVEIGKFSNISVLSMVYVTVLASLNVIFNVYDLSNFRFNGQVSPWLALFTKVLSMLGKPLMVIVLFLKRFESASAIEKLLAVQKVLGLTQYKMYVSIKIMTMLLIMASAPVVYIIGFQFDLIFLIFGASFVASISSRLFHFTYLISCVSACFDGLGRRGLAVVDEFSVKKYVQMFSHLIQISSSLNGYFEFVASFTFLMTAVDFVNAASRMWATSEATPVDLYMGLTPALLAHIGILHVVAVCQSATDKIQASLLMHLGAETAVRFEIFRSMHINYHLVISIIAAYATYIIMMYQLDHVTPAEKYTTVVSASSYPDESANMSAITLNGTHTNYSY